MKKIISYVLIALITFTVFPVSVFAAYVSLGDGGAISLSDATFAGTGTELDPFLIQDAEDLAMLATSVNRGDSTSGVYYKQTTDIDLPSGEDWVPIGLEVAFAGMYDGDGHEISNLSIVCDSEERSGLFGYVNNGTIKNVNLDGGTICRDGSMRWDVGSVVGTLENGTVSNCSSSTSIFENSTSGISYGIGGIVGSAYNSIISNCVNSGDLSIDSHSSWSGGIVGIVDGEWFEETEIINCKNYGDTSISEVSYQTYAGGIMGSISEGSITISDCSNYGDILTKLTSKVHFGGIVGTCNSFEDVNIMRCSNAGDLSSWPFGDAECNGGGIVGSTIYGNISECYNSGNLTVRWAYHAMVGGIVGEHSGGSGILSLNDCFNVGSMICRTENFAYMGGIIGHGANASESYSNCYNVGEISAYYRGGIAGWLDDDYEPDAVLSNCYYADTCDTGIGHGIGTATSKTVFELKQQASFIGFDFTDVWEIAEGQGLPILQNVPFEHATGVSIDETLTLDVGTEQTLLSAVSPADATNKNVTWSSDNESVATVADGVVTGCAAGTAKITATTMDGSYTDTCDVTVTQPVTGVSLDKSIISIEVGETGTLTATVSPANATNKKVVWTVNKGSVATVSQSGVVTALSVGTATVTATANYKTDICEVRVVPKEYSVSAAPNNPAYGTIYGGGVYIDGGYARVMATPNAGCHFVRWTINDIEVSTSEEYTFRVTRDCTLIAVFEEDVVPQPPAIIPVGMSCSVTDAALYGAKGSVTVTASGGNSGAYQYSLDNGATWQDSNIYSVAAGMYTAVVRDASNTSNTATRNITVGQPAHVGNIAAKNVSTKANAGTALTIVPPAAPKGYSIMYVSWSSSNPSVATVDANGNVTFLAGGKATIITKIVSQMTDSRGRMKTKTTTIKKTVTVNQPIASISLNLTDITIARKGKVKLSASINPASASNKKLTWKSSNAKVASVSSSGVVVGKSGGTAVITCTAKDGSNVSASCTITVTPIYPTGVKMNKTKLTVKAGKTASLKATVLPSTTDFKAVTWASSNPAVATVDAKGRVRAISSGTAVVTVTTNNGLTASCTVTVP